MGRIKTASGSISGPVPAATGLQVHPSWFEDDYSGQNKLLHSYERDRIGSHCFPQSSA